MHNATSPTTPASHTTPTAASNQKPFLSTEEFMTGLHPDRTHTGKHLPAPGEPLGKLKAVVSLLLNCQDEETQEIRIDNDMVAWELVLIDDLIKEAEERADNYHDHCHILCAEIKARLNTCHLIAHDRELWGSLATAKEV